MYCVENIKKKYPNRESSFFRKFKVSRHAILTLSHIFGVILAFFPYYHGVANRVGMGDLLCYVLFGEIRRIWNCTDDGRSDLGNLYNPGSEGGRLCFFIINLVPYLGKPAFLILNRKNMCVLWPGDWAQNSKLKNAGFWLSLHIFWFLYILTPDTPRWRPDINYYSKPSSTIDRVY